MNRFTPLIVCLLLMLGGCQLFKINDGRSSAENKEEQQALCEKGVKANAILQDEYTEMEVASSVSYLYKYDYEVNGKTYTGNLTKDEELQIPIIAITYNPDNPESVTTTDPCAVYAKIKDMPATWPQWIEYIGVGAFLLGLAFAKSSAVKALTGK